MYKLFILLLGLTSLQLHAQRTTGVPNTRIDNLKYWAEQIKAGRVAPNPKIKVPLGKYVGSELRTPALSVSNSQDVVLDNQLNTEISENSVSINLSDGTKALNSNNAIDPSNFFVSEYRTTSQGSFWNGSFFSSAISFCDPATAIGNNGTYFIGHMSPDNSQVVEVSTNQGASWTQYLVASANGAILDKNHLCVDKSIISPYQNYLYSAWTDFGGTYNNQIAFSRSTNGGVSWSSSISLSAATAGGSHDQGVNLQTGPLGEVYATWTIYDSWPSDETAIGFTRSTDGGATFSASQRILTNIRGIRITGTPKNMRVNSFPSMAVDNSFGPYRGSIYIVWANVGIPGINTGSDVDIYLIRSTDGGTTWSVPHRVNTVSGGGHSHYFPWISCDPTTGKLHVVYYDDRNVSSTDCETWMSSSFDGGDNWTDYRVSDVSFTPSPITIHPFVAPGYFGDYIGVTSNDDILYPVWTDNRTGQALAYTSPLIVNDLCATNLSLQNISMPQVGSFKYRAQSTITVAGSGTGFVMQGNGSTGARASMIAGTEIRLLPNTEIQLGSQLTIAPGLCTSNILRIYNNKTDELKVDPKNVEPEASGIKIYPNPSNGMIYINFPSFFKPNTSYTYMITDLIGKELIRGKLVSSTTAIKTDKIRRGAYLLIIYENGKMMETKKMIKE